LGGEITIGDIVEEFANLLVEDSLLCHLDP
jgi:hypothetical protein